MKWWQRNLYGWRVGIVPRFFRLPGGQAKTYIDLPFCRFFFCWQSEGRYTDPSDERVRNIVGVRDWKQRG